MPNNFLKYVCKKVSDNAVVAEIVEKGKKKLVDTANGVKKKPENQGALTKPSQTFPRGSAAKPQDPERELLLKLFKEFPQLAVEKNITELKKKQLLAQAQKVYRSNETGLTQMQAQDDFINRLNKDMTREYGMLGILNNLLEASRSGEFVRWNVYCSYARKQMKELKNLEQKANERIPGKLPESISVEELVAHIRKQMVRLKRQLSRTRYLPLYAQLKELPFDGTDQELSQWYQKASAMIARGLNLLDSDLRQALVVEYPEFSISLQNEWKESEESGSMEPSKKERMGD